MNGTVVDCATKQKSKRDLYVKNGLICEGEEGSEAKFVIDAAGDYVLPGLVDEHAHLNYACSNVGTNADLICIPMGVTTAVDGGTSGWANFDGFYNYNILRYTPRVLAYLHVSPYGVHNGGGCVHEENHDPHDFIEEEIMKKAVKYPDTIVGLKVRLCEATLEGGYDIKALERTIEIANDIAKARGKRCIVDLHYDNLPERVKLRDILDTLRPGDVLSHVMQTHKETIFTPDGHVKDIVKDAQKRGILMDDCHGRVHWSFQNLKNAYADGFYPDIISSDAVRFSMYLRPGCSLVHAMCVSSAAGMNELDIFKAVTYTPAKALGILDKAGTLEVGKPADICIMKVKDDDEVFDDWWGGSCKANKLFIPMLTMKDGVIVYRQSFI